MAGRGRGATLPSWMTNGGGFEVSLAQNESNFQSIESSGRPANSYQPGPNYGYQQQIPPMQIPPMQIPPMQMPMMQMPQGGHSQVVSAVSTKTGKGRRRSESPEHAVRPWVSRKDFPSNFDVLPMLGHDPPSIMILPAFQQGAAFAKHDGGVAPIGGASGSSGHGHSDGNNFSSSRGGAGGRELTPAQTKHARRIYVGSIPIGCRDTELQNFFNSILHATLPSGYLRRDEQTVVSVWVATEKQYGFVEFTTMELTCAAMTLDNVPFNHRSDVPLAHLRIKRPNDFKPELISGMRPVPVLNLQILGMPTSSAGSSGSSSADRDTSNGTGISKSVADGPNKIFVAGLPYHLTDVQVLEVLQAFGPLKAFNLVRDPGSVNSKGYAFCEYVDPNVTHNVVSQLHGLAIGDKSLTVKLSSSVRGGGAPAPPSMNIGGMGGMTMAPPQPSNVGGYGMSMGVYPTGIPSVPPVPPSVNSKVLRLSNMVTKEDLTDDNEFWDIRQDVMEECNTFGKVIQVIIPRIKDGYPPGTEGFIFVEFENPFGSAQAKIALTGRKFAERTVIVDYFDEGKYSRRHYI